MNLTLLQRTRLRRGIAITNRQSCDIKNSYPFLCSIAVYISYLISQQIGIEPTDEEISYIALYVGVAIGEDESGQKKLSCILFSPDHYATGQVIYRRIIGTFNQQLEITRFITTFAELNRPCGADLILSTVPLQHPTVYTLLISHFVTNEDIKAISKSAYDGIAIPHPINNAPSQSAISIFINPDGIDWSGQTVYAVFMLSISQDEVEQFSSMFDIIHQLTCDPRKFQRFLQITQYDEFINLAIENRDMPSDTSKAHKK